MFSKQLIIGLAIGAVGAGLGFMVFGGASVPDIAVSDEGNFKLLAQVIPNEPESSIEEDSKVSAAASNVIEVRASASAPAKKTTTVAAPVVEESEEGAKKSESVVEIKKCPYVTSDKPKLLGILSEVAWMGSADDSNAEWVEMSNHSKGDLDVSGWQLVDKAEQIHAIVPKDVVLFRGGFLVFERGAHQLPGTTVSYTGVISNTDEGVRLFDADCDLQDEVIAKSKWPAGTNSPKYTAERAKDLSWHTYYGDDEAGIFGTPGKKNSDGPPSEPEPEPEQEVAQEPEPEPQQQAETDLGEEPTASSSESQVEPDPEPEPEPEVPVPVLVSAGQLIISEVMAGTAANVNDEFIELYNTTNGEISLDGFSIKKKTSTGTESSLVVAARFEGKSISANGRFIIGREGQFSGVAQATWPASSAYLLAYTNNSIALYNVQGEKIDEVSWNLSAGQSYACASQGSCAVQVTSNPGE